MARPVLFLSDYGLNDEFVGVCHAVIARIAPEAPVVDLTHGIPPGDVTRGAIVLADTVPYAPANAIFLAVVDPGVGTLRLPVVVEAGETFLVGPDNGVLSLAWKALGGAMRVHVIESEQVTLSPKSHTFHGRDVFAPAAAHLAGGRSPERLGRAFDPARLVRVSAPGASVAPGGVRCRVIGVDRFGNVQLSARREDLRQAGLENSVALECRTASGTVSLRRVQTFAEIPPEEAAVLLDSTDRVTAAVNGGSAAEALNLRSGDPVELRAATTP